MNDDLSNVLLALVLVAVLSAIAVILLRRFFDE